MLNQVVEQVDMYIHLRRYNIYILLLILIMHTILIIWIYVFSFLMLYIFYSLNSRKIIAFWKHVHAIILYYRVYASILYQLFILVSIVSLYGTYLVKTVDGIIKLRNTLLKCGIFGVKIGQYLYCKNDVLNDELRSYLEFFLSRNEIHNHSVTLQYIEECPYKNIEKVGAVIGSGSIAQVNECYLKNDNKKYVLKCIHPNTSHLIVYTHILKKLLNLYTKINRNLLNIGWNELFCMIEEQQNLLYEKQNLERFYKIYKNCPDIHIPKVVFGNEKLIIMEYCEGVSMEKLMKENKMTEYRLAHNLLTCSILHSAYCHSIIHGDLHNGNILYNEKQKSITILDFGACIQLNNYERHSLYLLLKSTLNTNIENIKSLFKIIILPSNTMNESVNYQLVSEQYVTDHKLNFKQNIQCLSEVFTFQVEYFNKKNLIVNGKIMYFMAQYFLLESTFSKNHPRKQNLNELFAIDYMKKKHFFVSEFGYYLRKLEKLFLSLHKITNHEEIQKLKTKHFY